MTTMVKQRSYKSFFSDVSRDIILIQKYSTTIPDEVQQLKAIQVYWNQLVRKSFYWRNLSGQELDKPSINKIRRYLKTKLLGECHQAINDTINCKTSNPESVSLKKNLLEEYEDRLFYIKRMF